MTENPPADSELVAQAQAGSNDAFAELVRRYQRQAVSVAFRLLGSRDDASDVSQDAFVRAYRSLAQLNDPSRFGGWLMRTVSNLALNFRRARAGRAAASLDDVRLAGLSDQVSCAPGNGPLPTELHGAVTDAMDQLPDKQRLALVLFSVEGMPQKEVAEIMECSVELVKWNVFQARKKLREMLQPHL